VVLKIVRIGTNKATTFAMKLYSNYPNGHFIVNTLLAYDHSR